MSYCLSSVVIKRRDHIHARTRARAHTHNHTITHNYIIQSRALAQLDIVVIEGRDLVAKDGGMFTKASSDPFAVLTLGGRDIDKTSVVKKNLSPTWNHEVLDESVNPQSEEYTIGKLRSVAFQQYITDFLLQKCMISYISTNHPSSKKILSQAWNHEIVVCMYWELVCLWAAKGCCFVCCRLRRGVAAAKGCFPRTSH